MHFTDTVFDSLSDHLTMETNAIDTNILITF